MNREEGLGRSNDSGECCAPSSGRELRQEELKRALLDVPPERLYESLGSLPMSTLKGLLAKHHEAVLEFLVERGRNSLGGRIILDSDGTNYLTFSESPNTESLTRYRAYLHEQNRLLPGGAILGEVAQEFTRLYVAHPAIVDVWGALARHGIHVSILSGRSSSDLQSIYRSALRQVPGFEVRAAKGRIVCESDAVRSSSALSSHFFTDPLGTAYEGMKAAVGAITGHSYEQLEPTTFEEQFGYRISAQKVQGVTVLIRLHHRFRASMLAREAGAPVPYLDTPRQVDMTQLSRWLHSGSATATTVLHQLQNEDAVITRALSPLKVTSCLDIRDFVGHRSGCQDFSLKLPWEELITEIGTDAGILLYAGDNFTDSGNDRPVMEAIRQTNADATIIAVNHESDEPSDVPLWMVKANQFELFLIQYLGSRILEEAAGCQLE